LGFYSPILIKNVRSSENVCIAHFFFLQGGDDLCMITD